MLRKILAIFLLVLVLVGAIGACLLSSVNYQYCVNHEGQYGSAHHDEKSTPAVNPVLNHSTKVVVFLYCGGAFADANAGAITAVATVLLTVVTAILAWLAFRQGRTSRAQLRAYIAAFPGAIFAIDPNQRLVGTFAFTNGGRTPAYKVEQVAVLRIEQHPLPPNFRFPNLRSAPRPSRIVMHPGIKYGGQVVADNNFTQTQIVEILQAPAQGGRRLYVFGQVNYVDAFKVRRWTRYCASFQGRHDLVPLAQQGNWATLGQIAAQPGSSFVWEGASQHNDAK